MVFLCFYKEIIELASMWYIWKIKYNGNDILSKNTLFILFTVVPPITEYLLNV